MWTSKLGNKYSKDVIVANDPASQKELKRLRSSKENGNTVCADCGAHDNSWASVTHGVFLCIVCSDVHRAVGTHITKMKGCSGTYLWGPDELEKMQSVGNRRADELYGSKKVSPHASKAEKQKFVESKYKSCEGPARIQKSQPVVTSVDSCNAKNQRAIEVVIAPPKVAPRSSGVVRATVVPDSIFEELFGEEELASATSCKQAVSSTLTRSECPPVLDLLA